MNLLFSKKSNLQSMVFAAIMAAINIIFVALTNWIVFLVFILVFILPLGSALVSATCQKKYIFIYLVVSFLPSCFINLGDSIFYLMPSLISGIIFGLFINFKSSAGISLGIGIVLQVLLTFLGILIYWGLFHRDIAMDIAKLFNLQDFTYFELIKHTAIFIISTIQVLICYFVTVKELAKLRTKPVEISIPLFVTPLIIMICLCLSVGFAFWFYPVGIDFVMLSIVLSIYLLIEEIKKGKIFIYIEFSVAAFIAIILFAVFYKQIAFPHCLFLFALFPLLFTFSSLINKYLLRIDNNDRIES